MDTNLTWLTYLACATLIAVYAWERFNTPPSNRSSTLRRLYWSSCAGYVITALTLFGVLSALLQVAAWRTALLGSGDDPSLPPPLIATLAMTTLLPSFPLLKHLDAWILATFLDWGSIPAEVKRRAATLTPQSFTVAREDAERLRATFGDGSYSDTLATHLREGGAEGLEKSQYRFTRVVKLYDCIRSLAGEPRYARFFAETAEEFAELDRTMSAFLRRADTSLALAARLRTLETPAAYEELMHERRESFAQSCNETFRQLALFLARAVLRAEGTEKDIVNRLRSIGFVAAEPMNEPDFPIHALTALALCMYLYLAATGLFFSHLPNAPQSTTGALAMAAKITLARLAAVAVTVWLIQQCDFFRRRADDPPKYFAYVVCGIVASAVTAVVCVPFALHDGGLAAGLRNSLPLIVLSGMLCATLALCCNDWADDAPPPAWLRAVEAAGCASVMALGTSFVYFGGMLPPSLGAIQGWMIVAWITLPSVMAAMIGAFVPHIYRSARRAAIRRRGDASRAPAAGQSVPHDPSPPPIASGLPAHG
jgi:hypothetical protein